MVKFSLTRKMDYHEEAKIGVLGISTDFNRNKFLSKFPQQKGEEIKIIDF